MFYVLSGVQISIHYLSASAANKIALGEGDSVLDAAAIVETTGREPSVNLMERLTLPLALVFKLSQKFTPTSIMNALG
ncbi:MAG: hypothetical protein PVG14_07565, partial [Anaerolineales bacterium]